MHPSQHNARRPPLHLCQQPRHGHRYTRARQLCTNEGQLCLLPLTHLDLKSGLGTTFVPSEARDANEHGRSHHDEGGGAHARAGVGQDVSARRARGPWQGDGSSEPWVHTPPQFARFCKVAASVYPSRHALGPSLRDSANSPGVCCEKRDLASRSSGCVTRFARNGRVYDIRF